MKKSDYYTHIRTFTAAGALAALFLGMLLTSTLMELVCFVLIVCTIAADYKYAKALDEEAAADYEAHLKELEQFYDQELWRCKEFQRYERMG